MIHARRPPLHFPAAFLILGTCLLPKSTDGAPPAASQNTAAPQNTPAESELTASLSALSALGLPSSKGAKWVRAMVMSNDFRSHYGWGLPQPRNKQYSGDAWLLREEKDGTAELLIRQCQRITVRTKFGEPGGSRNNSSLPQAHIQPANLDADIAVLTEALSDPATSGDYRFSAESEQAVFGAAESLLFLAHLQQQGRQREVANLLPKVLSRYPNPEFTLNAAISALADQQLEKLAQDWIKSGDTKAYLEGIKKLQGTFTRGWRNSGAATVLSQRLQNAAVTATKPEALKAAEFLAGLSQNDLTALRMGRNWLHPGRITSSQEDGPEEEEDGPAPQKAANAKALKFLEENPRQAALGLAQLLDEKRLLRLNRPSSSNWTSRYDRDNESESLYTNLPRPIDMGELARLLLEPTLPYNLRQTDSPKAEIIDWVQKINSLTDEQLGWEFLRNATTTSNGEFSQCLAYLVNSGSDETIRQLRAVFVDPMVWKSGDVSNTASTLAAYIKRAGSDAAFEAKIKTAVQSTDSQFDEGNYPAEYLKQAKERAAAQAAENLKVLEQALHPRGLKELLAELADTKERAAGEALLTLIGPELAANPAESGKLYSAAAKIQDLKLKVATLYLLVTPQRIRMPGNQLQIMGGRGQQPPKKTAPQPFDADTKAALAILLADQRPTPGPAYPYAQEDSTGSVADLTAMTLVFRGATPAESSDLTGLSQFDNKLSRMVIMEQAQALAKGENPPPKPDAASVPASRVNTLISELAALPPDKILEMLRTKTASEQLAVYDHLSTLNPWPAALQAARATIQELNGDEKPWPKAAAWKGRQLNAELKAEIQSTLEATASADASIDLMLSPHGMLGGLTLTCRASLEKSASGKHSQASRRLRMEDLKQFAGEDFPSDPPPIAVVFSSDGQDDAARPNLTLIWADAAKTKAWKDKKAKMASDKKQNAATDAASAAPERMLLRWALMPIAPKGSPAEPIEPGEPDEPEDPSEP